MSTIQTEGTTVRRADTMYIWERQVRPVMDAISAPAAGPARAVVVGNAGSGKSTMLRELHRLFSDNATHASLLADSTDVSRVPRSHVLLVDDLHLLNPDQVERVQARSEDPSAALVVTSRPWPRMDALTTITRSLERSRPAIVLGHVSRSDVLTYLSDGDRVISSSCVDHLLAFTGGVSWLVSEALALHDERDCADDDGHHAVIRAIEDRIAHRLDTIPSLLRHEIESLCVSAGAHARPVTERDDIIAQGYAEGLLMRNGQPVPLVRSAVRATIPVGRLIDLSANMADGLARSAAEGDADYRDWIGGIHDPGIGSALVEHADRVLEQDPARALDLYDGAIECGVEPIILAGRRAQAAWASARPEVASSILDDVPLLDGLADSDRVADTSAAIWSLRAMMRMSDAAYRSLPPVGQEACARAAIAAIGSGQSVPSQRTPTKGLPSTLGVAMSLLDRGLRATLSPDSAESAVADLVRASEMYTSSATSSPIPELPAVIAAIVAMNVGDLDIAHTVIEDAIRGGHGGDWARTRLLLWRSWLAVQRSRPQEAREALERALGSAPSLSARDQVLAQAVRVAIARRYEDAAALDAAWNEARDSVLHTEADLFMLLPLAELVTSAARVGDTARLQPHFLRGLEIVAQLGSPPLWSVHLNWAGIQQGILSGRPDVLKPHARALVAASSHSPIAAVMSQAGRVWTATLAGSVDADAVEAAAHGLASAGLGWDGARLAGHGASRSTDRKVSARLLSCARELHPNETLRAPARIDDDRDRAESSTSDRIILSERERDVARLVLQGKTYAEIGETIFISPRTAEHHIAHIRRRLGATSRSDLIAKLRVVVEQPVRNGERVPVDEGAGV
ncbi:DNA-binding transcriptional regulator, CsgD family [Microbacterium sp. cf046]|uniref:helix-turn-helix transcriptional regulator n=1 Tax=Microbacterium sp. cf046 TaxID=1761803 RepID=UPI0008E579FE|nr:helix-turn-helix transcriptional regulator [Microbacterium sp. cf046]SFR94758.1 DNA-binding transcriptional regulator, CsgD family [Microbacterium sp. cf046]